MTALENALCWLASQKDAAEESLRQLVEISSHTADRAGNSAAASRILEIATSLAGPELQGATRQSPSGKFGDHVTLGTGAGGQSGRTILCIGHHDTVFPAAAFSGFHTDGDKLRGPGVLDMKGGLIVIVYALGALKQAGLLERVPVRVVSVSDEEVGSPEGKFLVQQAALGCRAALVFESGRPDDLIITQRKGTGAITVAANGKAAHAGNAHAEGKNAIWSLSRFVDRAQQLTDYGSGVTVNVGAIRGGIGKNTVPDYAEALVDIRFIRTEDAQGLLEKLRQAAAQSAVEGTRVTLEGGITRPPLDRTPESLALLEEYGRVATESGLGCAESELQGGGSDANTASAVGVPAIDGLGPRGEGYHTVEEYIERDSLIQKAAALTRFLAASAV